MQPDCDRDASLMLSYVVRRLLFSVPTLIGVSLLIFTVMRVLPGDVVGAIYGDTPLRPADLQQIRHQLNLDQSLPSQYLHWLGSTTRLNFGTSLVSKRPISQQISRFYPVTLELAVGATIISLLVAIPVGVLSAVKQDSPIDYLGRSVTFVALAVPHFWLGILVILVLSRYFSWLPPVKFARFWEDPWRNIEQLAWPVLVLGFSHSAVLGRMTRSQVLEVIREDYVRTAYAKGLKRLTVLRVHVLKNAIIPVVTIVGLQFGALLGGTVVLERVFNLPGLGTFLITSIQNRDYPVVQALTLLAACAYIVINLSVDILYVFLNPRLRYG